MMDFARLNDRVSKGMGSAARRSGDMYVVYRPAGTGDPLFSRNRVIRLNAVLQPTGIRGGIGPTSLWRGLFDSAYTQPGDYLVGTSQTFFIGAQLPASPVTCLLTNRVVTLSRRSFIPQAGYGGASALEVQVATQWPAVLSLNNDAKTSSVGARCWAMLLPLTAPAPQLSDVATDNLGYSYSVSGVEQTLNGWRSIVEQNTP